MAKITTTISIEPLMLKMLKKQARSRGLDVSAYIAHMVLVQDLREQEEALKAAMREEYRKAKGL